MPYFIGVFVGIFVGYMIASSDISDKCYEAGRFYFNGKYHTCSVDIPK